MKELVAKGALVLMPIRTAFEFADLLTKASSVVQFNALVPALMGTGEWPAHE